MVYLHVKMTKRLFKLYEFDFEDIAMQLKPGSHCSGVRPVRPGNVWQSGFGGEVV